MTPQRKVFDAFNDWYWNHKLYGKGDALIDKAFDKLYLGIEYAQMVVNREIVACKYVIEACERMLSDFERDDYGDAILFNFDEAMNCICFYTQDIKHVKGKWAGKPVDMMNFHAFIIINLIGWQKPRWLEDEESGDLILDDDGLKIPVLDDYGDQVWVRRFNTAYVEVARKNAKSFLGSGMGLYMTEADGEGGAEVYSAATTKDQARIVFDDAKEMIRKSPGLTKRLGHHKLNIHHLESASKFEPLSADANTLDGKNIHCGIVDELHAHKTRDVWDVLETATGAREQPLILAITTAGFILDGICIEQRDYGKKILDGVIQDDSYFSIIYTLDEDDDPFDESVWFKANPALGIAKRWDDLRRLAKKAKEQVSARPNFLTKHMNIWVRGETTWMNMDKWEACGNAGDEPTDQMWIGVDLAQKIDISAAIKTKLGLDNKVHVWCKFWIPEERLDNCSRQMAELYRNWANEGYLEITDGAVIDQTVIKSDIDEWVVGENLQEVAYDPWSATQFALSLMEDGKPVVEVPQSVKNLSEAMKQSEAMVYSGDVLHDHNPVMTWMMSNVCVKEDKNSNIFPLKERAENKIDGPVAWFTAMSRVILGEIEQKNDLSWYDEDEDIVCF